MKRRVLDGNVIRDLSLLLFLLCTFAATFTISLGQADRVAVYQLLVVVQFAAAVFGFFGRTSLCLVIGGTQVCVWAAYRIFMVYSAGIPLVMVDFVWLALPLVSAASVLAFQYGSSRLEKENALLQQQVEDLVMVDPLTGLYNLRTLYREIPIMIRSSDRHELPLSLLIIRLRYEQELRSILPGSRFSQLVQRMANIVDECVRMEDRVFSLENGSFALLLVTDKSGIDVVKNRIRNRMEDVETFSGILDKNILVSIRIGGRMYVKEEYTNPMDFKQLTESELAYDV